MPQPLAPALTSRADIVRVLLAAGAIQSSAVVEGELRIVSSLRERFALHEVQHHLATLFIVKTASDAGTQPYLFAEGAVLEYLQSHPRLAGLGPRCRARDRHGSFIVLEYLRHPVAEHSLLSRSNTVARARALAALHRETLDVRLGVTTTLPPVFGAVSAGATMNQAARSRLLTLSPAPTRLLAGMHDAARSWRRHSLIHTDVKKEHWFADPGGGCELRLIDWELVRFGDPAWDLAGALHDWIDAASIEVDAATAEAAAFLASYRALAGSSVWPSGMAGRVALSTAARLVQTALERLNTGSEWRVLELLQRADQVFRTPGQFAGWIDAASSPGAQ